MKISIIIPARNRAADLPAVLDAVDRSTRSADEVIVVDDDSHDETRQVAADRGVTVLRSPGGRGGAAAARNEGGRAAAGDVLLFIDADVEIHADAVERVERFFAEHPDHAACFGSYDTRPVAGNFLSQYRNLMHHYVHQISSPKASTFWAGCGAVRRAAFAEVGGFDTVYRGATIEDIEFGMRLRDRGHRVALVKELQCAHRKRWTLVSMMRADILHRAVPWTRLILRRGQLPCDLNLRTEARASAMIAWLAVVAAVAAPFVPPVIRSRTAAIAVVAAVAVVAINAPFYRFLARCRGPWFALTAVPWHLFYFLYASAAFAVTAVADLPRRWRHVEAEI